jgi:osmotically-inducible protein OsmY
MKTTSRALALLTATGLILTAPLSLQRTVLASSMPRQTLSDDTLKDRIEYRLETTDAIKKYDLHVKVVGPLALLTGTVATAAQKARPARSRRRA